MRIAATSLVLFIAMFTGGANAQPGTREPFITVNGEGRVNVAPDYAEFFADLRKELVPIVQALTSQPPADDTCLRSHFPHDAQLTISKELVAQMGYDFQRGRLDLTPHPFETTFSVGDVRILTRVKEDMLSECLYGVLHEAGHGMYEQGVPSSKAARWAALAGLHSQSRLWENIVNHADFASNLPQLQTAFPGQFGACPGGVLSAIARSSAR
jgi:carboxypeptidase Taq